MRPLQAATFAHRDRGLFVNIAAMYLDPGVKDTHDTWVAGLADSLDKDEAAFKTAVLSLSYAPIRD